MKPSTISIVERARRYTAKMPEAISGQHGHSTMFQVACTLVQGFSLDIADARMLLAEYNNALTEPFTTKAMEHKLEEAAKAQSSKGKGHLLNPSDKPIRVPVNPKKPAGTPPKIIQKVSFRTPRTGVSYVIKKKTLSKEGNNKAGELKSPVLPVLKATEPKKGVLPTLSNTGVLRIPFNTPIRYRYWLKGTSFEQSVGQILSLGKIRESLKQKAQATCPPAIGSCADAV